MQHLLTIKQFSPKQLNDLLDLAQSFIDEEGNLINAKTPIDKTVFTLFFENSTRTRCSFALAAEKLGMRVINLDLQTSSEKKGETLLDTIANLRAMGGDYFVVRHGKNGIMADLADSLGHNAHLFNAGEGSLAHPTQALADMLTIRQYKPELKQLTAVIIGDCRHSRVARSQIAALRLLGVSDIRLVAPNELLPDDTDTLGVSCFTAIEPAIEQADVITCLRIQRERLSFAINTADYQQDYCLNNEQLKLAKADAIVLHPGPINRNVEISSTVADGPQAKILQQVRNGVAVRMAALRSCLLNRV